MKIIYKIKDEFFSKNLSKPELSDEKDQDKKLTIEVIEKISEIIDNKYYFKEIVKKEIGTLLDDLNKKESQIAKNVLVELRKKHPELVYDYKFKQNMQ